MHIIIKNKILSYGNYKVKCAVGKRGIGIKFKEGDLITPKGIYKITKIFLRKDRIKNFRTKIKTFPIKKNMGWCNDPNSKNYNKLINYPFNSTFEKLFRKDNIYDVIMVLNYNMKPVIKNKGSAIFLHISKKNYSSTEGCIAISKSHIKKLLMLISSSTIVKIV